MPTRSPIIFWLLLAATLCLNIVAIFRTDNDFAENRDTVLYFGSAYGQLSVLTVWAVLRRTKVGLRWLVPFVAAVVFSVVWTIMWDRRHVPYDSEILFVFISLLSLHVLGAMIVAWLLKPTQLFARWTVVEASRRWQFGVSHLLVTMTCLAVLLVVLGRAVPELSGTDSTDIFTMLTVNVLLLLAVLVLVERLRFWLFSLAGSLGAALVLTAIVNYFVVAYSDALSLYPLNLIQAIVLWCWITVLKPPRESIAAMVESRVLPAS